MSKARTKTALVMKYCGYTWCVDSKLKVHVGHTGDEITKPGTRKLGLLTHASYRENQKCTPNLVKGKTNSRPVAWLTIKGHPSPFILSVSLLTSHTERCGEKKGQCHPKVASWLKAQKHAASSNPAKSLNGTNDDCCFACA
jgi:hypothetical protein